MLIAARKEARLAQEDVAERIGWTQTKVSKVERGVRRMDVVEFLQFAEAIGFDPLEFIEKLQSK